MDKVDNFDQDIDYPEVIQEVSDVANASSVVDVAVVVHVEATPDASKASEVVDLANTISLKSLKSCRKGVPNFSTPAIIATVWACIAMSEEELG